ncbi:MAG TPA: SUMF1/EgtB/PvdO family nonheme iron enzyme [Candidatus Paceibacterota bacterium]|nr:SUMF1/EgtB/PvdO family nonheme iron enzyme [Verrucomicrobiota bacterium]HRZ45267.1 SUMF1/EgtB/PvdO family nonheme iron enzyme [Candidatus Paceibacterota bacterium]HRZ93047.1 SUMF1/EgtB/PvdO family nonheme iron enzyme [Candidatus Paceibacterota bacterium]
MIKRVALVVGINRYSDPAVNSLAYADQDATELFALLKYAAGFHDVRKLAESEADDGLVLKTAAAMCAGLQPGDLFLFYFAGHGYELNGRHLLLGPEAALDELVYYRHAVPVDLLRDKTSREGVARLFILDACRRNLLRARDGGVQGMRGSGILRELVAGAGRRLAGGPLSVLVSCEEDGQAQEVPDLRHGLFSQALIEELQAALAEGREVRVDDQFEEHMRQRMGVLAERHHLAGGQRPWTQRSGDPPVLAPARPGGPPPSAPAPKEGPAARTTGHRLAICPVCGHRNVPEKTFRCRQCGRDWLCERHLDAQENTCRDCAPSVRGEREEATRRYGWPREGERWENSLGMKFVALPGTLVLFGVWPARVRDYAVFAEATRRNVDPPEFAQEQDHPVVKVTWEEAQAFCAWLTERERLDGRLGQEQHYRLPTDQEWSAAAGLPREPENSPKERSGRIGNRYPWGREWPPPKGAGNYDPALSVDDFAHTSPVGVFPANAYGLHDLGGNVWEWCEDWYDETRQGRVLRGASWRSDLRESLLSSYRNARDPGCRRANNGFRCVVAMVAVA